MSSLLSFRPPVVRLGRWEGVQWYAAALVAVNIVLAATLMASGKGLGGPVWVVVALGLVALLAEK
jgi:1,4-dihydroxy-2-naphthoate octaprenyltransferase